MAEIIGVRFKSGGKQYYFDPQGLIASPGQGVIIETSGGLEYGECVRGNTTVSEESLAAPLRPVIRIATEEDLSVVKKNRAREERAFRVCQQKITEHELDMKLVDVEYSFEGSKILFFFTSEGRVDFRALVKDLAAIFHTRIELRQIGVRDEAKMLGGLGICGKPFCCASFLDEFQPVSIKMAKVQNLSLNPTKISGTCGRLMCCLKYEQEAYEDLIKRCPKNESFVETPDGVGTVTAVNLLREQVKVRLEDESDVPKNYHVCEISVVRSGKGKRPDGYVVPSADELARRRMEPVSTADESKAKAPEEENRKAITSALEQIFSGTDTGNKQRPAPGGQDRNGSRNKNRKIQQERKKLSAVPAQSPAQIVLKQEKPQQQPQVKPAPAAPSAQGTAQQGEGAVKKPGKPHRRWRGKPKKEKES